MEITKGFTILLHPDGNATIQNKPVGIEVAEEISIDEMIAFMERFIDEVKSNALATKIATRLMDLQKARPSIVVPKPSMGH